MSEIYTCLECEKEQEISLSTVRDHTDEFILASQMLEGEDYGPLGYAYHGPPGCGRTVRAEIETTVLCTYCEEEISVSISVSGTPEWDDSRDDRDPRIDCYNDVDIDEVLPQDEGTGTRIDINSLLEEDDDSFYFDEFPDIKDTVEHHSVPKSIDLLILVKTNMNKGFCHLGYDANNRRIYRPLYRPNEGQCCWNTGLTIDSLYSFKALQFPDDGATPFTPSPHNREDLLVSPEVVLQPTAVNKADLFQCLSLIGQNSIQSLFNGLKDNKYVHENQNGPSTGVLKCHGANIKFYKKGKQNKVRIASYDFPYTGLDGLLNVDPELPALVLLGLGRPWCGKPFHEFSPKRCYVLALRVLQVSGNV